MKNKAKVLLIQPNYDVHVIAPPLGLGYLASSLEKEGHEVFIYDGTVHKAKEDNFLELINQFEPHLVGIQVMARGHNRVKELAHAIKEKFDIPIVLGGPQVTACPESILQTFKCDFVVIGEGEITLCELVNSIMGKKECCKIDGLGYVLDGAMQINKPRKLIKNLDTIPFPAWHLIPPSDYRIVPILSPSKTSSNAPIMTTRGCPFRCTYCASNVTWHYKFRRRSAKNIVDEIELLVKEHGVEEIFIADDNLTLSRKHAEEFCDEIISRNLNIPWQCGNGVRIDRLDLDLLKKMKKAGCYSLGLGIESANRTILNNVKKNLDLAIVEKALLDIKKVGIRSYGFFIIGLPGETHETVRETIDFAKNKSFDRAWFNMFTPLPGSEIFNDWSGERCLDNIDWDSHDGNTAVAANLTHLSAKELVRYQKRAAIEFYSRPKMLLNLLFHLNFRRVRTLFMTRFFKKLLSPWAKKE